MKNSLFLLLFSSLAAIILTGCASSPCFKVKVIDEKITVDGKLNEKAWKSAQEYRLQQIDDLSNTPYLTAVAVKRIPFELSKTSMLIDRDYLYIGIAMNDKSIFTEADKDQTKLVNLGDAVGINLMPMNKKCFWQFQFSPNKKYSSFYCDGLGSMSLPSTNDEKHFIKGIKFGVYTNKRPQSCWVAEIAIPLAELAKKGIELDNNWTVIVYRKNAGSNLRSIQNSSFPKMPMNNVNLVEYYSPIVFVK